MIETILALLNSAIYWLADFAPASSDTIDQLGGFPLIQAITAVGFCFVVSRYCDRRPYAGPEPHLIAIAGIGMFFAVSSWLGLVKGAQLAVKYSGQDPLVKWPFVVWPASVLLAALVFSAAYLWLSSRERSEGYFHNQC